MFRTYSESQCSYRECFQGLCGVLVLATSILQISNLGPFPQCRNRILVNTASTNGLSIEISWCCVECNKEEWVPTLVPQKIFDLKNNFLNKNIRVAWGNRYLCAVNHKKRVKMQSRRRIGHFPRRVKCNSKTHNCTWYLLLI